VEDRLKLAAEIVSVEIAAIMEGASAVAVRTWRPGAAGPAAAGPRAACQDIVDLAAALAVLIRRGAAASVVVTCRMPNSGSPRFVAPL
jgi:hypothetical protein